MQEYEDVLEANKDKISHIGNVLQMKARVLTIILKSSKSPQHVQEKIDNVISAVEKDSSLTAEIISRYTDEDIDQFRFLMSENHANAQEKRMENASPDQRFENFYNSFFKSKFSPEFLEIIEANRKKIIEILADFRLQHAVLRNIVSQAEVSFLQEQIDHILKELRENKRGDVSAIRYADGYRFLYITKTQQKQKMHEEDDFFKLILGGIKFIVQSGVERKRLQEYKNVLEGNKDKISHIGNVLQMKPRVLAMILRSPSDPRHLQQKIDNVSNILEKRPDLTAEVISKYTEKDVDQFRFLMLRNLTASQARERSRALLRERGAGEKRQEEERHDGGKMPRMDDRDYGGGGFEGDGHKEGGLEFERFPEDFLAMPISNDDGLEIDDELESVELYFPEVLDFLEVPEVSEVPDFSEMLDCLGVPDLTMVGASMEGEDKVEGGMAVEGGSADATVQGSDSSGQQGGLASGVSGARADNLKKGSVTKAL